MHTAGPGSLLCKCFSISSYQGKAAGTNLGVAWPRTCCALCLCLCVGNSLAWFQGLARPEGTPNISLSSCWRACRRHGNITYLRSLNLGSTFLIAKSFLCSSHPGQISPHVSLCKNDTLPFSVRVLTLCHSQKNYLGRRRQLLWENTILWHRIPFQN